MFDVMFDSSTLLYKFVVVLSKHLRKLRKSSVILGSVNLSKKYLKSLFIHSKNSSGTIKSQFINVGMPDKIFIDIYSK